MTPIESLHKQVKQVCQNATGVSIGRWENKATWRVTGPLTPAEQDTAEAIFQAFDKVAYEASQPQPKTREEKLAVIEAANTVAQLKAAVKELL